MKIGYGAMSGAIYLITGPSERNPESTGEFSVIRLDDGHIGAHTSLVNVREFTINDLLNINSRYIKHEDWSFILQGIKELVQ